MTTIAVVANEPLASALTTICRKTLGSMSIDLAHLDISFDAGRDEVESELAEFLNTLNDTEGLLILTGLYGATPDNLARILTRDQTNRRVVTGVNLPMLLRACNYASRPLDELADIAVTGGQKGIAVNYG